MQVLPGSKSGKSAIGLGAAIVVLAVLVPILEYRAGVPLTPRSFAVIMLGSAFGILGIAALTTSLLSMIKNKERTVLVPLVFVLSFFALLSSADMMFAAG